MDVCVIGWDTKGELPDMKHALKLLQCIKLVECKTRPVSRGRDSGCALGEAMMAVGLLIGARKGKRER